MAFFFFSRLPASVTQFYLRCKILLCLLVLNFCYVFSVSVLGTSWLNTTQLLQSAASLDRCLTDRIHRLLISPEQIVKSILQLMENQQKPIMMYLNSTYALLAKWLCHTIFSRTELSNLVTVCTWCYVCLTL